jgi:ABC-type transport system involved in multi-copper enzyme maturation permease subunit
VLQWSLFVKELRENRVKFFLLLFAFFAAAIIIPLSFGLHREFLNQVELSRYIGHQNLTAGDYSNYAWNQWLARNLNWFAALAAIGLGAGTVSGEAAAGTALFLAARPVTRREIYTTKVAAGLTLLAVCVFGSTMILVLTSSLKGYLMDFGVFLMAVLITFAGAAVVYLSTAALSAVLPTPDTTILAAAVIWLLLSIPGYFGPPAEVFSIFYQMKAVPYWVYGQDPIVPLGLFLVLIGLLYELGVWLWSSREL